MAPEEEDEEEGRNPLVAEEEDDEGRNPVGEPRFGGDMGAVWEMRNLPPVGDKR